MASNQEFVDYVTDQMSEAGEIKSRRMFGEYGIHADGKFLGVICDNKLFIKPTEGGREFIGDPEMAPAYPGARPSFLIGEKLEDREWLCQLVRITVQELPKPNKKKKKKAKR